MYRTIRAIIARGPSMLRQTTTQKSISVVVRDRDPYRRSHKQLARQTRTHTLSETEYNKHTFPYTVKFPYAAMTYGNFANVPGNRQTQRGDG